MQLGIVRNIEVQELVKMQVQRKYVNDDSLEILSIISLFLHTRVTGNKYPTTRPKLPRHLRVS